MSLPPIAVPIAAQDADWEATEHMLQACARTSLVRVTRLWSLSIPHLETAFADRTRGRLVLPCFFPVSELEENSVAEVCGRGFRFDRGVVVQVGNLELSELEPTMATGGDREVAISSVSAVADRITMPGRTARSSTPLGGGAGRTRTFEVFLCHAGVGRSQLVSRSHLSGDEEFHRGLHPGEAARLLRACDADLFDSVYLHRKRRQRLQFGTAAASSYARTSSTRSRSPSKHNTNRTNASTYEREPGGSSDAEEQRNTFQHEYLLREGSQLLPKFLVHFELQLDGEEKFAQLICDSCHGYGVVRS
eukprot:GSA25T00004210001.1